MNFDRTRLAPFAYLLALLAFAFAFVWVILNRRADLPFQLALGLAIALLAAGVLLDPDRIRRAISPRQLRYGSNALLLTVAFGGILGVTNYFAAQNPTSWDLTEDRQYSLAPETRDLITGLDEPVEILAFFTPNQARARDNLEPLLNRYQAVSEGAVSFEFVDPNRSPLRAEEYGITRAGSLVVIQGDVSEVITNTQEQEITGAILRVTQPEERIVYFLSGHGERDLGDGGEEGYSRIETSLASKNYTVAELTLAAEGQVPADADVLVVPAPERALMSRELEAIEGYLEDGGALFVLLEPPLAAEQANREEGLVAFLEESWSVEPRVDVVVDLNSDLRYVPISASYGSHAITSRMGNLASYFPSTRSLGLPEGEESSAEVTVVRLIQTGQRSWGERDLQAVNEQEPPVFDEGVDTPGPLTLAVAATNSASGARLVVVGDSDFASNSQLAGFGNLDIFVNSVDWLAGQEQLIQLTPQDRINRTVVPPSVQTVGLIFLISVVLVPGGVVAAGVSVWWQRRQGS